MTEAPQKFETEHLRGGADNQIRAWRLEDQIAAETFIQPRLDQPGGLAQGHTLVEQALACLTICVLIMKNGAIVIGRSHCMRVASFDVTIGQKVAREDAYRQALLLERYHLYHLVNAPQPYVVDPAAPAATTLSATAVPQPQELPQASADGIDYKSLYEQAREISSENCAILLRAQAKIRRLEATGAVDPGPKDPYIEIPADDQGPVTTPANTPPHAD